MIKTYELGYYKFRRSTALFFYSVHISKLVTLPNMHFQRVMTDLFWKVYRHFYGNLLAELLTVYSCKIYRIFLQCIIGLSCMGYKDQIDMYYRLWYALCNINNWKSISIFCYKAHHGWPSKETISIGFVVETG